MLGRDEDLAALNQEHMEHRGKIGFVQVKHLNHLSILSTFELLGAFDLQVLSFDFLSP